MKKLDYMHYALIANGIVFAVIPVLVAHLSPGAVAQIGAIAAAVASIANTIASLLKNPPKEPTQ